MGFFGDLLGFVKKAAGLVLGAAAGIATFAATGNLQLASAAGLAVFVGVNSLVNKPASMPTLRKLPGKKSVEAKKRDIRSNITSNVANIPVVYGIARVGGSLIYASTTGTDNKYLQLIYAICEGEISSIDTIYINNISSTNSRYNGLVVTATRVGTDTQTAFTDAIPIEGWTSAHQAKGVALCYLRLLQNNTDVFNGIPQVEFLISGKKIYDARTSTTAFSKNPALVIRDYLTNTRYGKGIPNAQIDDTSFNTAADYCDASVTFPDSSTGARYEVNGVIQTEYSIMDNLRDIFAACRGFPVWTNGTYKLRIDKAESSVYSFNEDNILGGWTLSRAGKRGKKNKLEIEFVNAARNYETDVIIIKSTTYLTDDNNVELVGRLDIPMVSSRNRVLMIGKQELEQSRQDLTIQFNSTIKALQVEDGDVIDVTHTTPGWTAKKFRVASIALQENDEVSITATEYDADVYDVSSLTDTPTDDQTGLQSPYEMNPPGNPVVTEELFTSSSGTGVKPRAILTWTASSSLFIHTYAVEYLEPGKTIYKPGGITKETTLTLNDLTPGYYTFRVKAINSLGYASSWASSGAELFGITAVPANITGFDLAIISGNAHLTWTQATDLDVKIGGTLKLKWTSKTASASWVDGIDIGPSLSGISTNATVPLNAGTYMIKAVDSVGNESASPASILVSNTDILNLNIIKTITQNPAFSGTKTNMAVDGDDNTLKLDTATLWDSIPGNIDDWVGNIDNGNNSGIATSGEYLFYDSSTSLEYVDFGAVYTLKVIVTINSTLYDAAQLWDSLYPGINIDSWPGYIDGTEISGITTDIYIATTDDNPAGAPTWSAWKKFTIGDYSARAIKIKATFTNTTTSNNIKIYSLSAVIDMPERTEKFLDQSIAAGGSVITWAKPFFVKPEVATMIQGVVSGDTPNITHTLSGTKYVSATVQILNGGAGAGRTVDIYGYGY